MKKIPIKIVIIFFISFVFSLEGENVAKYMLHLKNSVGQILKSKHTGSRSISVPGIGYIKYSETYTQTLQHLSEEGGFGKLKVTLTDMITDNRFGQVKIDNFYWTSMNDVPCLLYINSDGFVDHVGPINKKDSYLQEAFEEMFIDKNDKTDNYKFAFSQDASNYQSHKSVGDSWEAKWDSVMYYINDVSPASWLNGKSTYTLKNVKKRNGREIAYVNVFMDVTYAELYGLVLWTGYSEAVAGVGVGKMEFDIKWDIDAGKTISSKWDGFIEGDFKMGDKEFATRMYMSGSYKLVE